MASEEPRYRSMPTPEALQQIGAEIRLYEQVLIASVRVQGATWRDASSMAFRPLANYIFGQNAQAEQIGMTTPVTTHMVANDQGPVWEVRFFMPDRYALTTLPDPQSPYIRLDEQEQQKYAVVRFSGAARDRSGMRNFATHEQTLRQALNDAGLDASGVAHYAVYNGPWTPNIMRRNEVLIALD